MDSSEEKELFLLGFILLDDKKNKTKKKTKKRRFWVREIFRQRVRETQEYFHIFFVSFNLEFYY